MNFKKRIFFFFAFIIFISCERRNNHFLVEDLSGSWHSCLKGHYIEYHFTENHAIGFLDDMIGLTYVHPYSILEDTLVVFNDLTGQFSSSKFELGIRKKNLILYAKDEHPINLVKFSNYSVFPLKGCDLYGKNLDSIALIHYEYMFNKRKKDFVCEEFDSSVIQIHPDSIDMELEEPSILEPL